MSKIDQEVEEEFQEDVQRFMRQNKANQGLFEDQGNQPNKKRDDLERIYGEEASREQFEHDEKLRNDTGVDINLQDEDGQNIDEDQIENEDYLRQRISELERSLGAD